MQKNPAVSTVHWIIGKFRWLMPCSIKRPIPGIDIIGSENISGQRISYIKGLTCWEKRSYITFVTI